MSSFTLVTTRRPEMPYIIGFGGEPATGKSTVMKTAMAKFATDWELFEINGYGYGIKCMVSSAKQVTVLGHYIQGEAYGGTDRMSMSIQPSVVKMLSHGVDNKSWGFWFEGDRLFNAKFLHTIKDEIRWPNFFFVISSKPEAIEARHVVRDHQNETWLAGRKTKVANIKRDFNLVAFDNNNLQDLIHNADLICNMNGTLRAQSERQFYA